MSLWKIYGRRHPDENHFQCLLSSDSCFKWKHWKQEFDEMEAELREEIAMEIESLFDGLKSKNEFIEKYAPVDAYESIWRSARIARNQK